MRPLALLKENIIEIINDISYVFLSSILIHYNTEENWSQIAATFVVSFMTGVTTIIGIIQVIVLIKLIVSYWKKKCAQSSGNLITLNYFSLTLLDSGSRDSRRVQDIKSIAKTVANVEVPSTIMHTNVSREPTSNNSHIEMISELRAVKRYVINDAIEVE